MCHYETHKLWLEKSDRANEILFNFLKNRLLTKDVCHLIYFLLALSDNFDRIFVVFEQNLSPPNTFLYKKK